MPGGLIDFGDAAHVGASATSPRRPSLALRPRSGRRALRLALESSAASTPSCPLDGGRGRSVLAARAWRARRGRARFGASSRRARARQRHAQRAATTTGRSAPPRRRSRPPLAPRPPPARPRPRGRAARRACARRARRAPPAARALAVDLSARRRRLDGARRPPPRAVGVRAGAGARASRLCARGGPSDAGRRPCTSGARRARRPGPRCARRSPALSAPAARARARVDAPRRAARRARAGRGGRGARRAAGDRRRRGSRADGAAPARPRAAAAAAPEHPARARPRAGGLARALPSTRRRSWAPTRRAGARTRRPARGAGARPSPRRSELYYERPPAFVRGWRHHLYDADGRAYVDMVNNVAVDRPHPPAASRRPPRASCGCSTRTRASSTAHVGVRRAPRARSSPTSSTACSSSTPAARPSTSRCGWRARSPAGATCRVRERLPRLDDAPRTRSRPRPSTARLARRLPPLVHTAERPTPTAADRGDDAAARYAARRGDAPRGRAGRRGGVPLRAAATATRAACRCRDGYLAAAYRPRARRAGSASPTRCRSATAAGERLLGVRAAGCRAGHRHVAKATGNGHPGRRGDHDAGDRRRFAARAVLLLHGRQPCLAAPPAWRCSTCSSDEGLQENARASAPPAPRL